MRIGGTQGVSIGIGGSAAARRLRVEPTSTSEASRERRDRTPSRALVPLDVPIAEAPAERLARHRTHAPFLAQLLGAREDFAQTRERRRAEPQVAARAYGAAMDGTGLLVPGYLVDTAL